MLRILLVHDHGNGSTNGRYDRWCSTRHLHWRHDHLHDQRKQRHGHLGHTERISCHGGGRRCDRSRSRDHEHHLHGYGYRWLRERNSHSFGDGYGTSDGGHDRWHTTRHLHRWYDHPRLRSAAIGHRAPGVQNAAVATVVGGSVVTGSRSRDHEHHLHGYGYRWLRERKPTRLVTVTAPPTCGHDRWHTTRHLHRWYDYLHDQRQ